MIPPDPSSGLFFSSRPIVSLRVIRFLFVRLLLSTTFVLLALPLAPPFFFALAHRRVTIATLFRCANARALGAALDFPPSGRGPAGLRGMNPGDNARGAATERATPGADADRARDGEFA